MRKALGLPSPEEEIGYAAHDFTSLLGADRVYLTRAEKIDGVPTVPSRWLLRLQALLGGLGAADALAARSAVARLGARARSRRTRGRASRAPEPRPPLALRPRKLSVTRIETWIANPYAIFARDILELETLPLLGAEPDAALRGRSCTRRSGRFAAALSRQRCRPTSQRELMGIAEAVLADYDRHPARRRLLAAAL